MKECKNSLTSLRAYWFWWLLIHIKQVAHQQRQQHFRKILLSSHTFLAMFPLVPYILPLPLSPSRQPFVSDTPSIPLRHWCSLPFINLLPTKSNSQERSRINYSYSGILNNKSSKIISTRYNCIFNKQCLSV